MHVQKKKKRIDPKVLHVGGQDKKRQRTRQLQGRRKIPAHLRSAWVSSSLAIDYITSRRITKLMESDSETRKTGQKPAVKP